MSGVTSNLRFSAISIILIIIMLGIMISPSSYSIFVPAAAQSDQQHKRQVVLHAMLVEPKPRWDILL